MKKTVILIIAEIVLLTVIVLTAINAFNYAFADAEKYYIICDPDSYVNARGSPQKKASIVGRFECGDAVFTDGRTKNGYLHIVDCSFEQSEAWIKTRYLVRQKPQMVSMTTVVMLNRTLARNGVKGAIVRRLEEGSAVKILVYTPEWCYTNKGYIRTDCLGVN